ncbi:PAS domain-containing protein [Caballeronia glebae]|uniref:PAS domain-containing protein n=1 Tax=Caballeronia glebae TaxID=1777143 RepID=UPI001F37BD66|nr:PAS domain S-box protein [Caballeronia glebae]
MTLMCCARIDRSIIGLLNSTDDIMEDSTVAGDWILDQIADAVIFADRLGTIVRWNRSAVALFGYAGAEAMGQSLDLIIPPRLRDAHWRSFEKAVTAGATRLNGRATLTRATHKDGRQLYVEMTFALVLDPHGGVCGSVAVARNVTAGVESEKSAALRRDVDSLSFGAALVRLKSRSNPHADSANEGYR